MYYLPFVLRTPFFGGKKYLRRAKISVETSETRKRYDTCVKSLSVISGKLFSDNATKPCLRLKRFLPSVGLQLLIIKGLSCPGLDRKELL